MSFTYWEIEGLGFDMKEIRPMLDAEKLRPFILDSIDCDLDDSHPEIQTYRDAENLERLAYLEEYVSLAEVLSMSDDKNLIEHANDGEDGSFLIYQRQYPWQLRPHEISTEALARLHLCQLVLRFMLPEVTLDDVLAKIDYIDEIGSAN